MMVCGHATSLIWMQQSLGVTPYLNFILTTSSDIIISSLSIHVQKACFLSGLK